MSQPVTSPLVPGRCPAAAGDASTLPLPSPGAEPPDLAPSEALSLERLLGDDGPAVATAIRQGERFLRTQSTDQLLELLGQTIPAVEPFEPIAKTALPAGYGGNQTGPPDDFLVGQGLFYLSERRRLYLDCTAGHYQMLWGYRPPALCRVVEEATRAGIVWDNHSNIPQAPVKQLARRLVALANPPGETDPLDTVLLGVCTGSVACAAALKIQLRVFGQRQPEKTPAVLLVLDGNYHGSDMLAQFMRGMWPGLTRRVKVVTLPPNDSRALAAAFRRHGAHVAGFWAESVMMNREAIAVQPEYLLQAQEGCRKVGALFCLDEIQTGFWQPEVFAFRALGLRPDLVVLGKGMTAGFHPLSGVLLKRRHDVLAQYDAISTNGSAALPALVGLANLELIQRHAGGMAATAGQIDRGFADLAAEFPERIASAQGRGFLAGLKFRAVEDALGFHRRALAAGLWTRVHAYHAGHSTVLTKLGLLADASIVDHLLGRFRRLLREA